MTVGTIFESRVRETWTGTGTGTITLAGPMRGSLSFAQAAGANSAPVPGSTFDYVISYDDTFEEGSGTIGVSASPDVFTLSRDTVNRALHSNGTVDQTKVSFAAGTKTVIGVMRADRGVKFVSYGESQSLTGGQVTQARANVNALPSGTKMLFQQTSAPTFWTKDTTHDDKALRIVSGTVGSGGSSNFSTVFAKTATDNTTLVQGNLPSATLSVSVTDPTHTHGHNANTNNSGLSVAGPGVAAPAPQGATINAASTGITASAALGGSGTAHTHPIDIRVKYVDSIVATKN